MGDMTKFNSAIEYYIFNVLLMCLLISEIFIFFYTRSKQNRTEKIDTRDLVQIPLHRITDSASNGSVFPVVTEHFSASSDHAFL